MDVKRSENAKDSIARTIEFLKKDIQRVLDKKKMVTDSETIKALDEEKKSKMKVLREHTEKLKEIHKGERERKQKENELKRAERAFDSIEFGAARKKRDGEAMTRAKKAKEIREKAKTKFNEYMEYQKKYAEVEPKEYPGILFLHDKILTAYGMCPYIKIEISDNEIWDERDHLKDQLREQIRQKRCQWLQEQDDRGLVYYDLHKMLVERVEINEIELEMRRVEDKILMFMKEHLTEQQLGIFEKCTTAIHVYAGTLGKTKRIKEQYKELIHSLSILHAETSLNIHEYLAVKFRCVLEVNDMRSIGRKGDHTTRNIFIAEMLDGYINELRKLQESKEEKDKYTKNIVRNLENDLYLFLTEQKAIEINVVKKQHQQVGKYFKRWGVLSDEERDERFTSYAEHHVEKHMMREKFNNPVEKSKLVEDMSKLLINAYKGKGLIYRDLKWNTTKGYIEEIKVLKFDEKEQKFVLTNNLGKGVKEISTRRSNVQRSLLTDGNEKLVHEEILYYIIKRGELVTDEDKTVCLEKIKSKMNLKKISVQDKKKIGEKFDEILKIVQTNKSD